MTSAIIRSRYSRRRAWRITGVIAEAFVVIAVAAFGFANAANAQAPWKNAHISAGSGFVTDIIAQPKVPNLFYLRTDVGGFYRWNPTRKEWIPISDFIPVEDRDLYGGESIAVDPNNANTVYIACGGASAELKTAIFKSTDRGETWTELGLNSIALSGDGHPAGWSGERLVAQPGHSNVIMYGTHNHGLWKTTDGGADWQQTSLTLPRENNDGVQAVAFDPNKPNTVYAAVAKDGIFRSTNSGDTWTNISTSITRPERLTVAQDSTVWVTYKNGVSKYANGQWRNVTPRGATANAYCGLAISPCNQENVIVSYGLWGDTAPNAMFMTGDGGVTWTRLNEAVTTDVPWYLKIAPGKKPGTIDPFLYTPISNFMFDPNNPSSVWFASAGGIYNTPNINRRGGPLFHHVENGHEELCVNSLLTPPIGHELLTGTCDVNGFVFDKGLNRYPSSGFNMAGTYTGSTCSLAYEERDPKNMVALWAKESPWKFPTVVLTSHDGGFVWHEDKSFSGHTSRGAALAPLGIAVSADTPDDVVVAVNNIGDSQLNWLYKKHGMTTWEQCSGLPTQPYVQDFAVPIAADPKAGATFYAYVAGVIYRSTDGGASFRQMSSGMVGAPGVPEYFKLIAEPGTTGALWLSEDNDNPNYASPNRPSWEGLYHSADAGRTWTKVPGVSRALLCCFGKASSSGHPTLYYYGRHSGDDTDRVFRSTDLGKTWTIISLQGQTLGDRPFCMEGSSQTFGRVFVGTLGRGIYYNR